MRTINKIIIHCSATPEGRHHTVADIDRWHKERGFNKQKISGLYCGYHYVIYLDGSVHEGRNISEQGAHTTGHNANSIGICYIGGTDANAKAKDTRTPEQKTALKNLICELKVKYPQATIHGHNEFANKACPSFDVEKEF
jgi:N-acetylmuramoyl-L-alanine amidase